MYLEFTIMRFPDSQQKPQLFLYLIIVYCDPVLRFVDASGSDSPFNNAAIIGTAPPPANNETSLVTYCRYTYPHYVTPYVISCRSVPVDDIPLHDNVTKMELVDVPLTVLNDTLIPRAVQSDRVSLRQLRWIKSHITLVENVPIPYLTELDLSWNIIREVRPTAIRQLVNLQKLNFSRNNIQHLPDDLFGERNSIAVLSLSHNELPILPRTIFDALRKLEILDLSNNLLSRLSETLFARTTRLQNLDLSHNRISVLPTKIFFSLALLRYLTLEDNHLHTLEADIFLHLHELMVLNLGRNPLGSLPNVLLPNNNTLFILTISHTRLHQVKLTALQNLRRLSSLHLTNNVQLGNLPDDIFQNVRNLRTISLENNNFTSLPTSLQDTKPTDLFLDGNPWPCDCNMQWIAYWLIYGVNGGRKSSLHLNARCNGTNQDLLEMLLRLLCRPNVIRVTPFSNQKLDSSVRLTCRAYVNPRASIGWLTPSGPAYPPASREVITSSASKRNHNYYQQRLEKRDEFGSSNIELHENGDLDIIILSRNDVGEYTCVASNQLGESHAFTKVYADPSVMERIKLGSVICGLLWINTFLIFSALYLLKRKYKRRMEQEKRTERMQKNMDVYILEQLSRLRERSINQMNRIKNNCCMEVEWTRDNFKESISHSQNHRSMTSLMNRYQEQVVEIRKYYHGQMNGARQYYDQQRILLQEFNKNRVSTNDTEVRSSAASDTAPVKITSTNRIDESSTSSLLTEEEEEEIYKYNDAMKTEIQMLTSSSHLHNIFVESTMTNRLRAGTHPLISTDAILYNNDSSIQRRVSEEECEENSNLLLDI